MEHAAALSGDSALFALARAHGVDTEFDTFGGGRAQASPDTLIAVLAALGVDARTPERIELALREADDAPWRRVLPPVVVQRQSRAGELSVHVTDGDPVTVSLELESGEWRQLDQSDRWVEPRTVDGRRIGRATFVLPEGLPLGWHRIRSTGPSAEAETPLAVVPDRVKLPAALHDHPRWGLMVQLYSVRSRESWGLGDLRDLADLAWLTAPAGADFLLINPLHAAEPVPPLTPSPYLPTSRRFLNPLYLRVEDVPEVGYLSAADRALIEWAAEPAQALDSDPGPLDRDAVWTAKRQALEVLFAVPRTPAREAAFAAFRVREGQGLDDFALWCALVERYGDGSWPDDLRGPTAPGAHRARIDLADRIAFHAWLQWQCDQQLGAAQHAAREAGMAVGVMHDLAVGVHPAGADAWALGGVLAGAASVGAPPDMYNQQGQDWSQPPWHPAELARVAYRPYRDLLRTVFRHAGAVRIDHIMGLFRLWWIPRGQAPGTGTYVRYDVEAMLGILLLEAHRAGAIVIGEDLGVVEPGVRELLAERGVLGTSVLWFEKDEDGNPRRPEDYRRLALSTVTTHDLPPTAGYLADEHVALRERLGLLTEPVPVVRAQARAEREQMLAALRDQGLLGPDPTEREIVHALHRYIRRTPSVLVGVSLADAVGERRAQNQPGTDTEYPNWKVPLADSAGRLVPLEQIVLHPRYLDLTAALRPSGPPV